MDFSGSKSIDLPAMLGALAALPALPALFSGGSARAEGMVYGFEAVVFNGKRTARKALDTLEGHARPTPGSTTSRSCRATSAATSELQHLGEDDRAVGAGATWGMITGALLGLIAGPGGALAGAATAVRSGR